MQEYLSTNSIIINKPIDEEITQLYSKGYVLTRLTKGCFNQIRSLRIDLSNFVLTSENKRVLNKNFLLEVSLESLPLKNYSWEIHKLGKIFYTKKFGEGIMSASKIKEMFNDIEKSNMNSVFIYRLKNQIDSIGYSLSYTNSTLVHYAYPFYNLEIPKDQNIGLAMMTRAIVKAKEDGKEFFYIGSVNDSKAKYKLQFKGMQWWDNQNINWNNNIDELKKLIK